MSEPFLGEIRMVGWNFAANGWALCNGQLMPISQYQALFSLLGRSQFLWRQIERGGDVVSQVL